MEQKKMEQKKLQTRENEGLLMKRIRNQLRIHWNWLKDKEDYNEVADFIDACIRQAIRRIDELHLEENDKYETGTNNKKV